jgi:hypothetical protein
MLCFCIVYRNQEIPDLPPYKPERKIDEDDEDDEVINKNEEGFEEDNADEDFEEISKRRQMEQLEEANENERLKKRSFSKTSTQSTPKVDDPYASDETSYIIPILVAIGAFIPLLFCLCKL